MVEPPRPLAAEQHGKRAAPGLDVLLHVAGVVREHDEAHAQHGGHGPQKRPQVERARERLVARERDEPAHHQPAHQLADGQVRDGRLSRRVQHDRGGAHDADSERNPARNPDHVPSERKRRRQEPDGEAERRARIYVVVHEHSVGGIHVVVGRVGALHVVVVVVERVHRRLHEHADGQKHARRRQRRGRRVRDGGGGGHERRQDGRGPGVRRRQLHGHANREAAEGSLLLFASLF